MLRSWHPIGSNRAIKVDAHGAAREEASWQAPGTTNAHSDRRTPCATYWECSAGAQTAARRAANSAACDSGDPIHCCLAVDSACRVVWRGVAAASTRRDVFGQTTEQRCRRLPKTPNQVDEKRRARKNQRKAKRRRMKIERSMTMRGDRRRQPKQREPSVWRRAVQRRRRARHQRWWFCAAGPRRLA